MKNPFLKFKFDTNFTCLGVKKCLGVEQENYQIVARSKDGLGELKVDIKLNYSRFH